MEVAQTADQIAQLAAALHRRRDNRTIDADDIEHAVATADRDRDGTDPVRKPWMPSYLH